MERPFDTAFRRRPEEPALALCGFDSNPARRDLATAGFALVAESGLGGTVGNFDAISFHTFPNPRPPDELWPDLPKKEVQKWAAERERMARQNQAYAVIEQDECGRVELAGKSIAVPFVGTAASTLIVAETLRLFHDGPAYTDIKPRLSSPSRTMAQSNTSYGAGDCAAMPYCGVRAAR